MYLNQAIEQVNASASPSDWLAWCGDWACWKPVVTSSEFAPKLKAPKGVTALPNRGAQGFPLEMKINIVCEGEVFKTKTKDITKAFVEFSDEAPRKFFQEPCEFEMSYMIGPENRKMRFKARLVVDAGQKKKWTLSEAPASARDFIASCLASVDFGTPVQPTHRKAA